MNVGLRRLTVGTLVASAAIGAILLPSLVTQGLGRAPRSEAVVVPPVVSETEVRSAVRARRPRSMPSRTHVERPIRSATAHASPRAASRASDVRARPASRPAPVRRLTASRPAAPAASAPRAEPRPEIRPAETEAPATRVLLAAEPAEKPKRKNHARLPRGRAVADDEPREAREPKQRDGDETERADAKEKGRHEKGERKPEKDDGGGEHGRGGKHKD